MTAKVGSCSCLFVGKHMGFVTPKPQIVKYGPCRIHIFDSHQVHILRVAKSTS